MASSERSREKYSTDDESFGAARMPAVSMSLEGEAQLDGVAGRAGDVADDQPFAFQYAITEGGFADIGPAHETDIEALFVLIIGLGYGTQFFEQGVAQLGLAVAVLRGNVERLAKAEPVERLDLGDLLLAAVCLVGDEHHRFLAPPEQSRDAVVERRDEKDDFGRRDGEVHLLLGGLGNERRRVAARQTEATSVQQGEGTVLHFRAHHIPRYARLIVDHGYALACQSIKKAALAHIGAAYHGDDARYILHPPSYSARKPACKRYLRALGR
jgi:hypothetical protein